jgi:microcystin-dependent protein
MKYHKIPALGSIMEFQKQDLAWMQDGLAEGINGLLSILGTGNYIISGVAVSGTQLTDGWIYYNGELLRFKGGAINTKFVILDAEQSVGTGDYEKYATPGSSVGAVAISSLQRVSQLFNLLTVQNDLNSLTTLVNGMFQTGMIMPFMGSVAPDGWLLCNGGVIPDNADHAALRAIIGSRTPNLDGLGIVGAGSRSLGSVLGHDVISLSEEQMPSHNHDKGTLGTVSNGSHTHPIYGETMQKDGSRTQEVKVLDTGGDPNHGSYVEYTGSSGYHNHNITGSTASKGDGEDIDVRNPSMAANFIIKV